MELLIISYGKWSRGALFVNARANALDIVLPMLMGVAEFLLFGVLIVDTKSYNLGESRTLWLNWSAFVAIHSFLGMAIVWNRLHFLDMPRDFDASLTSLVNDYRKWSKQDRLQTLVVGSIASAVWVAERIVASCGGAWIAMWVQTVFELLFIFGAWKPISDSSRQQNQIDAFVSGPPKGTAE